MADPIITPPQGSETFPANENEAYTLIETLAKQNIKSVKSTNKIIDGLYYDDIELGTVIEQAMIKRAQKVTFDRNRCWCDGNPIDPAIVVRYFNNWEIGQWETAIRETDIEKIIAGNRGATVNSVTGEILDTLTQGEGKYDFTKERNIIINTNAVDYATIMGGTPANMDGVLFALRDMYNQIRYDMDGYSTLGESSSTPEEDIRIAISDKLMALLDITKLANLFNLEKADIWGKLVIIPVGDLPRTQWSKIYVYDRMRFERYTRKYKYEQSLPQPGQFVKAILTTERMYNEVTLFKATQLDVAAAFNAEYSRIITATPAPDPDPTPETQQLKEGK